MIQLKSILDDFRLYEADDDKYASIGFGRFKLKGKEDDEDADVYVKTDSGKYEKSADQSSDDKGAEDDKPSPKKAMSIDKSGGFDGDDKPKDQVKAVNQTNLISISDLSRNPYQPRQNFKEEKLEELANSIRKNGILMSGNR